MDEGKDPVDVLVIEDDHDGRVALQEVLALDGWSVATASNGLEAVDRLSRTTPGLLLLDLIMPGMDGFEFEALRRSHRVWREIPLVVMSGSPMHRRGITVDEFLVKPVLVDELLDTVRRLLRPHTPADSRSLRAGAAARRSRSPRSR